MTSYISRKEYMFRRSGYNATVQRKRSEGRMKRHFSCTDNRAWILDREARRQYLLELLNQSSSGIRLGTYVPLNIIFETLIRGSRRDPSELQNIHDEIVIKDKKISLETALSSSDDNNKDTDEINNLKNKLKAATLELDEKNKLNEDLLKKISDLEVKPKSNKEGGDIKPDVKLKNELNKFKTANEKYKKEIEALQRERDELKDANVKLQQNLDDLITKTKESENEKKDKIDIEKIRKNIKEDIENIIDAELQKKEELEKKEQEQREKEKKAKEEEEKAEKEKNLNLIASLNSDVDNLKKENEKLKQEIETLKQKPLTSATSNLEEKINIVQKKQELQGAQNYNLELSDRKNSLKNLEIELKNAISERDYFKKKMCRCKKLDEKIKGLAEQNKIINQECNDLKLQLKANQENAKSINFQSILPSGSQNDVPIQLAKTDLQTKFFEQQQYILKLENDAKKLSHKCKCLIKRREEQQERSQQAINELRSELNSKEKKIQLNELNVGRFNEVREGISDVQSKLINSIHSIEKDTQQQYNEIENYKDIISKFKKQNQELEDNLAKTRNELEKFLKAEQLIDVCSFKNIETAATIVTTVQSAEDEIKTLCTECEHCKNILMQGDDCSQNESIIAIKEICKRCENCKITLQQVNNLIQTCSFKETESIVRTVNPIESAEQEIEIMCAECEHCKNVLLQRNNDGQNECNTEIIKTCERCENCKNILEKASNITFSNKQIESVISKVKSIKETEHEIRKICEECESFKNISNQSASQLKILQDNLIRSQNELVNIKEENDQLKDEIKRCKQTACDVNELRRSFQCLENDKKKEFEQMESYKDMVTKSKTQIQSLENSLAKARDELAKVKRENNEFKDINGDKRSDIDEHMKKLFERIRESIDVIFDEMENLDKDRCVCNKQVNVVGENEEMKKEIQSLNTVIKNLNTKLQSKKEIVRSLSQVIAEVPSKFEILTKSVETMDNEITTLRRKMQEKDCECEKETVNKEFVGLKSTADETVVKKHVEDVSPDMRTTLKKIEINYDIQAQRLILDRMSRDNKELKKLHELIQKVLPTVHFQEDDGDEADDALYLKQRQIEVFLENERLRFELAVLKGYNVQIEVGPKLQQWKTNMEQLQGGNKQQQLLAMKSSTAAKDLCNDKSTVVEKIDNLDEQVSNLRNREPVVDNILEQPQSNVENKAMDTLITSLEMEDNKNNELNQRIKEIEDPTNDIESIKRKYEEKIKQLEDDYTTNLKKLKDEQNRELEKVQKAYNENVLQLKEQHDRTINSIHSIHNESVTKLQKQYDNQLTEMKSNIDDLKIQQHSEEAIREIKSLKDKIQKLTHENNILKKHGGDTRSYNYGTTHRNRYSREKTYTDGGLFPGTYPCTCHTSNNTYIRTENISLQTTPSIYGSHNVEVSTRIVDQYSKVVYGPSTRNHFSDRIKMIEENLANKQDRMMQKLKSLETALRVERNRLAQWASEEDEAFVMFDKQNNANKYGRISHDQSNTLCVCHACVPD